MQWCFRWVALAVLALLMLAETTALTCTPLSFVNNYPPITRNGQSISSCCTPSGSLFQGYLMQMGYSSKTGRYYWTSAQNLYTSTVRPSDIASTSDYRLVNTYTFPIRWSNSSYDPPTTAGWSGDLFLINQVYTHPDPDIDHISYTNPHGWAVNAMYDLLVSSTSTQLLRDPIELVSPLFDPSIGTLRSISTIYDAQWNVSWWFTSNPSTVGTVSLGLTTAISWLNHETGEIRYNTLADSSTARATFYATALVPRRQTLFYTNATKLMSTPTSNNPFVSASFQLNLVKTVTLPGFLIYSLLYRSETDTLLVGGTTGMVLELDLNTLSIIASSRFSPDPSADDTVGVTQAINWMRIPEKHPNLLYLASYAPSQHAFGRMLLSDRSDYENMYTTKVTSIGSKTYWPGRDIVFGNDLDYYYTGSALMFQLLSLAQPFLNSDSSNFNSMQSCFFAHRTHTCSVHTSCSACQTDPDYCGWCSVSQTCTDSQSACTGGATDLWNSTYVCPTSTFALPSVVPSEGGTTTKLSGTAFQAGLSCIFTQTGHPSELASTDSSNVAAGSINCAVPPAKAFSGNTTGVSVALFNGPAPWGTAYSLTYTNCSVHTDCGSCTTYSGGSCGWCLGANKCTYSSFCPSPDTWTSSTCPSIDSISPTSVSARGGEVLTISATNIVAGVNYAVQFGSGTPVPATVVSGSRKRSVLATTTTSLQVTVPQITVTGSQVIPITVLRTSDNSVVARTSTTLTVYDCTQFSACSSCFAAGSKCNWCSSSSTCVDSSTTSSCSTDVASCASIQSANPALAFTATATSITLSGLNLQSLPITGSLNCIFQQGGSTTGSVAATISSNTQATCTSPASLTVGFHSLSLGSSAPLTNALQFEVYDCSGAPCSSCVAPGKASQCKWCNDFTGTFGCMASSGTCTTSITSAATCPNIASVSPSPIQAGSAVSLTVTGTNFGAIPVASTNCHFQTSSNSYDVAVSATSNTQISCSSPSFPGASQATVSIVYNSVQYSDNFNISVFSCAAFSNYQDCHASGLCGWCSTGCKAISSASCTPVTSEPTLTSVTPNVGLTSGGDIITIVGGPFVLNDNYGCVFDGIQASVLGKAISTTQVTCVTPSVVSPVASTVTLTTPDYALEYTLSDPLTFSFVACPTFTSATCSDSCVSFPTATGDVLKGCGFCVGTGQCTSQARCANLWVPECFSPTKVTPPFALLDGADTVSISVSTPPELPIGQSILEGDFTCSFGSTTQSGAYTVTNTSASVTTGTDSTGVTATVGCQAPISASTVSTYAINYRSSAFTPAVSFPFVNCPQATDCASCLALSPCGWCLDTQSCTTPTRCPLGNYTSNGCPDLRALSPSTGSTNGGQEISLVGTLFIPNPALTVRFGNQELMPTFVNNATLTVVSPKHSKAESVSVEIWLNGTKYATTTQQFSYQEPSKSNTVAIAVGVTLGLLALLAIFLIIAVVLWRKRSKGGLVFNVREPDYALVAFGANNELTYRLPSDQYALLETVLGRHGFAFQVALAAMSPPTEEDLVAKSMLYIAQAHGQSVGMINALVRGEIARCLEENTIFRNNSVASKSFKFYSRVVGIPYLWKCMARVIYELEVLGNRSKDREKTVGGDNSTSLLKMTMEVDMDRYGDDGAMTDVDSEVNSLQLKLTCQKLFSVLVKNGVADIPAEFRQIFVEIDSEIMKKFNNDMAVYKAIGGFFFLRFVCPSITAPHYYGLLDKPPNDVTQRQLVLISKVIQSLANMQMPGRKETYMESMSDFIEKNMGSVVKFYQDMREASRVNVGTPASMEVPDNVRHNALASLWDFIFTYQSKVQAEIDHADPAVREDLDADFKALLQQYPSKPKKLGDGAASSKSPRSKKKRNTKDSTV